MGRRFGGLHPRREAVPMSTASLDIPALDGAVERGGSLADFIWFRTGGPAEWLVRPATVEDLSRFLCNLDPSVPVLPVGVGSNLIVRDGGVPGVVVRLPKALAHVHIEPGHRVRAEIGRASCRERVCQYV